MRERENSIQRLARILPWLALACAFAPVLLRITTAIPKTPFGWSLLLAPALMLSAILRGSREGRPRQRWALILLITGLLFELLGLGGGSPGLARLGLPTSFIGLALWSGAPAPMTALLALWAIPIPGVLYALTTPHLESVYARFGAAAFGALGADLSASGPLVRIGAEHLTLDPHHSGIHFAFLTTLLAWYASIRNGSPPRVAVVRTACTALLALPLQILAVSVAIALFLAGSLELANFWLDNGAWLLTAMLGIVWVETR